MLKKLELKNASKKERKAAEQEAKLLSKLKHPNIVSYKDSFETGMSDLGCECQDFHMYKTSMYKTSNASFWCYFADHILKSQSPIVVTSHDETIGISMISTNQI